MSRERVVYIVELPNGHWPTVTSDEEEARGAYDRLKPFDAILLRVIVPEAQELAATH